MTKANDQLKALLAEQKNKRTRKSTGEKLAASEKKKQDFVDQEKELTGEEVLSFTSFFHLKMKDGVCLELEGMGAVIRLGGQGVQYHHYRKEPYY